MRDIENFTPTSQRIGADPIQHLFPKKIDQHVLIKKTFIIISPVSTINRYFELILIESYYINYE